ncbi:MAG: protein-L-isoaspartate O-methyltransferase [Parvibaculum sp.]|uniref:protein-L-isoaspartate O-methyltransferase family protein n=1 Tax=Parvibaculum sp. TaxID=2024848 RepID=UPI003C71C82C
MTDFTAARINMVESQVRCNAVTDLRLIAAMADVPRENFVPEVRRGVAYMDEDLRLTDAGQGEARYLMEPRAFAKLAQLAEISESDRVLDIGCATGYSTAVLARLAQSVIGLEESEELAGAARSALGELQIANASIVTGKLREGWAKDAPYDVIFFNGSVQVEPAALFDQLAEGGRLAVIMGEGATAQGHVFVKSNGVVSGRAAFDAIVHPLPGFAIEESFVF